VADLKRSAKKSMRAYLLTVCLFLFAGCAPDMSRSDIARWATSLSMSDEEIGSIVRQVRERHGLHIVRFDRQQDGAIAVMLADKPNRPHGIVVVFRKVGTRWEEDPRSQGSWIVKKEPNQALQPTGLLARG
jgi:hypothetical protein